MSTPAPTRQEAQWSAAPPRRTAIAAAVRALPAVKGSCRADLPGHGDPISEKALARWENEGGRVQQQSRPANNAVVSHSESARAKTSLQPVPHAAVIAAALDPIITIDSTGIIQSVSDSVKRVFGWIPAELVGTNVSVLMPEPHRSEHDGYLAEYHKTGRTEHLNRARRFEAVRKDGTFFPIEVCVSRVDLAGAAPLFVGIIRDLSKGARERPGKGVAPGDAALEAENNTQLHELLAEQTSALQRAHLRLRVSDRMASIGALAAGLGHDMNNMLLPVRAHLNAARALTMLPEVRGHVTAVQKSVTYLQQLADALHFLASDTDGEDAERGATDLRAWWLQVGSLLTKAVPKHVKVSVSLPKGLPEVAISAHRLTQAVLNLVVNAGQAIPARRTRGQGRVRVWAHTVKGGAGIALGVTDNGQGMSAEVQRNAFEMFYTTKSRGLGTGLGLPLVARVVSHAGGSVEIESEPGKGTTVTILLSTARRAVQQSDILSAVVTLTDGRAAALTRHLLEMAGVCVAPRTDPADAAIWVLTPTTAALGIAKTWCERHPRRRLVLFGKPGSRSARLWKPLRPIIIENPGDFDAIRAALGRATASL